MDCPNNCLPTGDLSKGDKEPMEKMLFHEVEVDYCPNCLGIWFDKDELMLAKNDKDSQLNWIDFDIWRDKGKFEVMRANKRCPMCRLPFFEIRYDDSKVKIDFCKRCLGIWLDRGEFKQVIIYLMRKSDYEILNRYTQNLLVQLFEVFAGPEKFREELGDFFMVLKLFNYKFMVQYPHVRQLIDSLPK